MSSLYELMKDRNKSLFQNDPNNSSIVNGANINRCVGVFNFGVGEPTQSQFLDPNQQMVPFTTDPPLLNSENVKILPFVDVVKRGSNFWKRRFEPEPETSVKASKFSKKRLKFSKTKSKSRTRVTFSDEECSDQEEVGSDCNMSSEDDTVTSEAENVSSYNGYSNELENYDVPMPGDESEEDLFNKEEPIKKKKEHTLSKGDKPKKIEKKDTKPVKEDKPKKPENNDGKQEGKLAEKKDTKPSEEGKIDKPKEKIQNPNGSTGAPIPPPPPPPPGKPPPLGYKPEKPKKSDDPPKETPKIEEKVKPQDKPEKPKKSDDPPKETPKIEEKVKPQDKPTQDEPVENPNVFSRYVEPTKTEADTPATFVSLLNARGAEGHRLFPENQLYAGKYNTIINHERKHKIPASQVQADFLVTYKALMNAIGVHDPKAKQLFIVGHKVKTDVLNSKLQDLQDEREELIKQYNDLVDKGELDEDEIKEKNKIAANLEKNRWKTDVANATYKVEHYDRHQIEYVKLLKEWSARNAEIVAAEQARVKPTQEESEKRILFKTEVAQYLPTPKPKQPIGEPVDENEEEETPEDPLPNKISILTQPEVVAFQSEYFKMCLARTKIHAYEIEEREELFKDTERTKNFKKLANEFRAEIHDRVDKYTKSATIDAPVVAKRVKFYRDEAYQLNTFVLDILNHYSNNNLTKTIDVEVFFKMLTFTIAQCWSAFSELDYILNKTDEQTKKLASIIARRDELLVERDRLVFEDIQKLLNSIVAWTKLQLTLSPFTKKVAQPPVNFGWDDIAELEKLLSKPYVDEKARFRSDFDLTRHPIIVSNTKSYMLLHYDQLTDAEKDYCNEELAKSDAALKKLMFVPFKNLSDEEKWNILNKFVQEKKLTLTVEPKTQEPFVFPTEVEELDLLKFYAETFNTQPTQNIEGEI